MEMLRTLLLAYANEIDKKLLQLVVEARLLPSFTVSALRPFSALSWGVENALPDYSGRLHVTTSPRPSGSLALTSWRSLRCDDSSCVRVVCS